MSAVLAICVAEHSVDGVSKISASSEARDRKSPTSPHQISLQSSNIGRSFTRFATFGQPYEVFPIGTDAVSLLWSADPGIRIWIDVA
jgi:hypothetical protein